MKRNLFTSSTVILAMLVLLLHQPAPVQAQSTMVLNAISNAMMLHRASDSGDSRRFTFWLGGPAVFDFRTVLQLQPHYLITVISTAFSKSNRDGSV